ncbi:hypothetical protein [Xanthocytophaga flavus]|nr:hypothetical protein [Xanthocytophaga flavus]
MKRPKKDQAPISQPNGLSETLADQTQLDQAELVRICRGFVNSAYYRKAMANPGYLREQAIFDFLTGQGYDSEAAGNWIESIRKNYYRAF